MTSPSYDFRRKDVTYVSPRPQECFQHNPRICCAGTSMCEWARVLSLNGLSTKKRHGYSGIRSRKRWFHTNCAVVNVSAQAATTTHDREKWLQEREKYTEVRRVGQPRSSSAKETRTAAQHCEHKYFLGGARPLACNSRNGGYLIHSSMSIISSNFRAWRHHNNSFKN